MRPHLKKTSLVACLIAILLVAQVGCQNSLKHAYQKQFMVAANDQRFVLTNGANKIADNPGPGSITLLDFAVFPPKVNHLQGVPCSVIGPPTCVAITPDQKLAMVTAAMKVNPQNPAEQIPDNKLTIIDLEGETPAVINTLTVGNQPSGISITRDGQTALVANRADGTITLLAIREKSVTITETASACSSEDSIAHIAIAPNGQLVLASLHNLYL